METFLVTLAAVIGFAVMTVLIHFGLKAFDRKQHVKQWTFLLAGVAFPALPVGLVYAFIFPALGITFN